MKKITMFLAAILVSFSAMAADVSLSGRADANKDVIRLQVATPTLVGLNTAVSIERVMSKTDSRSDIFRKSEGTTVLAATAGKELVVVPNGLKVGVYAGPAYIVPVVGDSKFGIVYGAFAEQPLLANLSAIVDVRSGHVKHDTNSFNDPSVTAGLKFKF